jgi:anti-sigma factor (TIGR02949 family)
MSHHHTEAGCRQVLELLSEFVDDELSSAERESLARHLNACPPCEEFLKTFQAARALCREALMERMPEELKERLRAYLNRQILKD